MFYEDVLLSFNEGNNTYMAILSASRSDVEKTVLTIQMSWTMIYCNRITFVEWLFPRVYSGIID